MAISECYFAVASFDYSTDTAYLYINIKYLTSFFDLSFAIVIAIKVNSALFVLSNKSLCEENL